MRCSARPQKSWEACAMPSFCSSRLVPARPKLSTPTRSRTRENRLPLHSRSVAGIDVAKSSRAGSRRARSSGASSGTESARFDRACASNKSKRPRTSSANARESEAGAPSSRAKDQAMLDNSCLSNSGSFAMLTTPTASNMGLCMKRSVAKAQAVFAKSCVRYSPMSRKPSSARPPQERSSRCPIFAQAQNMLEISCGISSDLLASTGSEMASIIGLFRKPSGANAQAVFVKFCITKSGNFFKDSDNRASRNGLCTATSRA
mmetsp:Transcript_55457/g.179852  ORF Transcript_55457/g.179852 Transcript_55457/m.179852 type:complete len:261 (+) Transcript_55457:122-904(+)